MPWSAQSTLRHSQLGFRQTLAGEYSRLAGQSVVEENVGFVNSLSVDSVEHRYLVSGAANSSMAIWDINAFERSGGGKAQAMARIDRKKGHEFGVTKVLWWPLDNGMFLSSSFDGTVKLWDTENLEEVYAFKLEHKVYNIDIQASTDSGSALVAAGLDHQYIRLLDLRSGSSVQSLQGHAGKVISVKWSPVFEYLLASAGSDGTVRLWDIRQARSMVSSMDMLRTSGQDITPLEYRRAHRGSVNGLCWLPRGDILVSLGNDDKARVWNLNIPGGESLAVNFGPLVRNRYLQTLDPIITPAGDLDFDHIFIPSDTGDILFSTLLDGKLVRRLEPLKASRETRQACITLRTAGTVEYFSGDGNGSITWWRPTPLSQLGALSRKVRPSVELAPGTQTPVVATLGDYIQ